MHCPVEQINHYKAFYRSYNNDLNGYQFHTLEVTKTSGAQYFFLTEIPKDAFNIVVNVNDENQENLWCCQPYTFKGGATDSWICVKFQGSNVSMDTLTMKLRISYWTKSN
jgi:hypothetical protein